jgi:hypothetical protein
MNGKRQQAKYKTDEGEEDQCYIEHVEISASGIEMTLRTA